MTSSSTLTASVTEGSNGSVASRVLMEGYGTGAWHGPDLKAALTDVSAATAFWRPGEGRHNIAEIALHHAWFVRSVIGQLTGNEPEPFLLAGADWFGLSDERELAWRDIAALVEDLHGRLASAVGETDGGRLHSPLSERERFDLVLGISCHAIYHAGQIQLLKVLNAAAG